VTIQATTQAVHHETWTDSLDTFGIEMFKTLGLLFGLTAVTVSASSVAFYALHSRHIAYKTETEVSLIGLTLLGLVVTVIESKRAYGRCDEVIPVDDLRVQSGQVLSYIRRAVGVLSHERNRFASVRIVVITVLVFVVNIFSIFGAALDAKYTLELPPALINVPAMLVFARSILGVSCIVVSSLHFLSKPSTS